MVNENKLKSYVYSFKKMENLLCFLDLWDVYKRSATDHHRYNIKINIVMNSIIGDDLFIHLSTTIASIIDTHQLNVKNTFISKWEEWIENYYLEMSWVDSFDVHLYYQNKARLKFKDDLIFLSLYERTSNKLNLSARTSNVFYSFLSKIVFKFFILQNNFQLFDVKSFLKFFSKNAFNFSSFSILFFIYFLLPLFVFFILLSIVFCTFFVLLRISKN